MKRLDERAEIDIWLVLFVVVLVLFMCSTGFGVWAFLGRQDYKKNIEPKIARAVAIAKQETSTTKDKEFIEKEKVPYKEYQGPATYGSIVLQYPKTWSAYVNESGNGGNPLDAYFHPNVVPALESKTAYALHVRVSSSSYEQELRLYEGRVRAGKVSISAYRTPHQESVLGSRVDGEVNLNQQGSLILLPLRDKTLEISTESKQFTGDFEDIILKNLLFVP